MRFQMYLGKFLEVNGVLFFPGMGVNKFLVSSMEDDRFGMKFRPGHVFLYQVEDIVGTIILLGDRRDNIYVLWGHVVHLILGSWLSEIDSEDGSEDAIV